MDDKDIYETLRRVFNTVFGRDDLVLRPDMASGDIVGWDSFRNFELMMSVEDVFDIRLTVADIAAMNNVGDMVKTIAVYKKD